MMLAFLLLQGDTDIRSVSWWLDRAAAAIGMDREVFWTIVLTLNFLALAWILYRALFKGKDFSLPGALHARGLTIREEIEAAAQAEAAAVARLAEIEARVAALPAEVAELDRRARAEAEAEYDRVVAEAAREADRIAGLARQEMAAAVRLAQKELKAFASNLALDLAEKRLRERLTPELDQAVVGAAVADLHARGASHAGH